VAAVRAFKLAFDGGRDDARLILKTHHVSAYAAGCRELAAAIDGDPRITVLDRTMDRAELDDLVSSSDAVMLLHRSEGFGLPLAEAMGRGLPVVATNWSGNTDFMDFGNSCPVSYCLVPARDPQGSYDHADQLWAEPSAENAAVHLRRLRDEPALRTELGRAASRTIRERCSPKVFAERSGELLMADAVLC
jgi:glycosyltransferase involved in cell wall biosynthesis